MKSRILTSILLTSIFSLPLVIFWADGDTASGATSGTGSTTVVQSGFYLSGISVEDDMHINLEFSENVVVDSVRIRIAKQSDGTNIKVESLTGVLDNPKVVYVSLVDLLEAGESYTMTVISSLSDKWVTITEGTDALSEFTAPDPLKQSLVVFNAPPNPTATTTESTVEPEVVETTEVAAETTTASDEPPTPESNELPLTGMNPTFFLIISALLALVIITLKKKFS